MQRTAICLYALERCDIVTLFLKRRFTEVCSICCWSMNKEVVLCREQDENATCSSHFLGGGELLFAYRLMHSIFPILEKYNNNIEELNHFGN